MASNYNNTLFVVNTCLNILNYRNNYIFFIIVISMVCLFLYTNFTENFLIFNYNKHLNIFNLKLIINLEVSWQTYLSVNYILVTCSIIYTF